VIGCSAQVEQGCSFFVRLLADLSFLHLIDEIELDALALGEEDEGLLALTDNEDVAQTGGERVAIAVLDVGNFVGTGMVVDVLEDSNTANVISAGDEDRGTVLELDEAVDFVGLEVEFDGVVLLDVGVGVADGAAVVGHNVRNLVLAESLALNLAELEGSFLRFNAMGLETSFSVVEDAEVFAGLGDGDNVHEAKGETVISSDFVVNLDIGISVFADLEALLAGESVLKSVAEQDGERQTLSQLVGASGGAHRVGATQFIEAPVGRCVHSLQMLFGSSCLKNV